MYEPSTSVARRILAAFSALAVVLGLTATAVALAPAASATGSITRIEVFGAQTEVIRDNPAAETPIRAVVDAWVPAVRIRATFTGEASYTVDGGSPTTITSDVKFSVPLHDGVNAITITNDGNTYPIEILHPWKITGFEVFDANVPDSPPVFSLRDAQFDPTKTQFDVPVPARVSSVQFKVYYDTPSDTDPTQHVTVYSGNPCDGTCESGEMTTSRGLPLEPYNFAIQAGWNGRENWSGYQASSWTLTMKRASSATANGISEAAFSNPTVKIVATSTPDVFSGAIAADSDAVDVRPIFRTGTVTWSVDGSSPVAITRGSKATVPMTIGHNTLLLTHRSPGGDETVYTYHLYRSFPITGYEIRDAANPDTILYSSTGDAFTQVGLPNPTMNFYDEPEGQLPVVTVPNSVANVQIRMFYPETPTSDPYVAFMRGLRVNYQCAGNHCESGEWSNSIALTAGQTIGAGPAVRILPAETQFFTDWRVNITRATSTVGITGIYASSWRNSRSGDVGAQWWAWGAQNVSGFPSPTINYQWQSLNGANWEDVPGATGVSFIVPYELKGRAFRVKAWASNGVAPDSAPIYSPQTSTRNAVLAPAPAGVSVVPGNAKVTVSWQEPAYAAGATDYTVKAIAGEVTKTCTTTGLTCEVTGLTNGTTYAVSVVANFGTAPDVALSAASTAVSIVPGAPVTPTMAAATITGTPAVGQRLTAEATGVTASPSPATLRYVWETAPASTGPWTELSINGNSTTFLGQAAEGNYVRVKVTATNSAGNVTKTSAAVGPVAAGTGMKPDFVLDYTRDANGWVPPTGLAIDDSGSMYTAASQNMDFATIFKFAPGATATDAPIAMWRSADNGAIFSFVRMDVAGGYVWILNNDGRVFRLATDATAADAPEYLYSLGANGDIAVDPRGYLYLSAGNVIGVYDLQTGRKLRQIWIGGNRVAMGLDVLQDGNIIAGISSFVGIYEGGPTGSNTPLRTFDLAVTTKTPNSAIVTPDGRVWITVCHEGCELHVYNINSVGQTEPLYRAALAGDTNDVAYNPVNGQVYVQIRNGNIYGFDAQGKNLGELPAAGAPGADSVSVTGSAYVESTVTARIVGVRGLPAPEAALQWQIAPGDQEVWTDIDGATAYTYVVKSSDLGNRLRARVQLTNSAGESTVTSAATAAVTTSPSAPVDELIGGEFGIYRPLQGAYLADDRVAISNEGSSTVTVLDSQTGDAESFIRVGTVVAGVSAAYGGGVWIFTDNKVQKWSDASGTWTMTRELVGAAAGYFSGATRAVEDAQGYLYVQFPYNKQAVFAPGATSDSAPLRELQGCTEGLAIDLDGNLLVGCDGWIMIYAGGASINTKVIGRMDTGLWVDNLEVDSAGRVWTYHRSGQIRAYDPRLRGTVTPSFVITPDATNKLSGATTFTVSLMTSGAVAAIERDAATVGLYDWSALVPAVPTETKPTVADVTVSGTVKVSQELTATAGAIGGYPTGEMRYQWQVSDNGTSGWTDIPGATSKAYFISGAYGDKYLRVKAWAVSHGGIGDPVFSAASTAVEPGFVRTQVGVIQGSGDYSLQQTGLVSPWYLTKLTGDRFIVSNRSNNGDFVASFSVFPITAANNDAPTQTIRFANLAEAWGSAQTSSGTLLLSTWLNDSTDHIYEVANDANGFATTTRDLRPNCGYGSDVAVGADGLIYVACWASSVVKVFAADADGEATPLRTIELPGFNPSDVGFTPDGKLYVLNSQNIDVFESGATGSNTALQHFETGYNNWAMAYDTSGRPLVAADNYTNIYAPGFSSLTPLASFYNDDYTRMDNAQGVIYDTARGDMIVANAGGWRIQRYDVADLLAGDPIVPAKVAKPTVTTGNRKLVVSWTKLTENVTGYKVEITGGAGPFTCTTTTAATCTFSFAGTPSINLVNGTEYSVTVQALNGRAKGEKSDVTLATPAPSEIDTPPDAPSRVVGTGLNAKLTVSWTAPAGTASKYQVRALLPDNTAVWCGKPTPITARTCTVDVVNAKTYSVQVRAQRSLYPEAGWSEWSEAEAVLIKTTPVIGAVTIAGTVKAGQTITGTVPKASGTPSPTLTYTWQTSGKSDTGFKDITEASRTLSGYDLLLADVGDYIRLKVSADNGSGDPVIRYSNVLGEILTKDGATKASLYKPSQVTATASGVAITASWTKPFLGNPAAYTVVFKPKSGTTVTKTYTVTDTSGDRMSIEAKGLAPGTLYSITVQVEGKAETLSTATTATTATAPAVVKGVTATVTKAKVAIAWSAPSTIFVGTYTVTLTPTSGKSYSMTTSSRSATWSVVLNGTYTLKIVATSDVGLTSTYTHGTKVTVKV